MFARHKLKLKFRLGNSFRSKIQAKDELEYFIMERVPFLISVTSNKGTVWPRSRKQIAIFASHISENPTFHSSLVKWQSPPHVISKFSKSKFCVYYNLQLKTLLLLTITVVIFTVNIYLFYSGPSWKMCVDPVTFYKEKGVNLFKFKQTKNFNY